MHILCSPFRSYRIQVGLILMGGLALAMFPNVAVIPNQVIRHIWMSETLLTPNDPLVLKLRDEFYSAVPPPVFLGMNFEAQMGAVDVFIKNVIPWEEDFSVRVDCPCRGC